MIMLMMTMSMTKTTPVIMATFIIIISIMTTYLLFKATLSSWLSFVIIMTFSSGMMTLFMYTASMAPNEESKMKKSKMLTIIPLALIMTTEPINNKEMKKSMKMFTSQTIMLIMGTILIVVMISISSHGHNPNQTMSTSF